MNVILCDTADEVTRLGLALTAVDPLTTVDVTTDATRLVEMAAATRPDVVVIEVGLAEVTPETIARVLEASPFSRVLGFTRLRDPARIARILSAGAAGYLLKEDGLEVATAAALSSTRPNLVLSPGAAALIGEELAGALVRVRELEMEVKDARNEMQQGTVAKADFLANISHELRTPVTVAKGISHVLRNPGVSDAERGEFVEQLQVSLDKLAALVDEVIEIAELERGTFELDISFVDLRPSIERAAAQIGEQYPAVPIISRTPPAVSALADGDRIEGVIRELLDNACRYSPEGAAVEIRARILDEGIVISVTDRGTGLGRDVAYRSFEQPFSTGEAILRKEKAGAGVGLHLSRQLVVRHGGILWSDPLPAGGTRVSFCLPSRAGAVFVAPPGAA